MYACYMPLQVVNVGLLAALGCSLWYACLGCWRNFLSRLTATFAMSATSCHAAAFVLEPPILQDAAACQGMH